ncbi:MAG TPA: phosphate ABC transporter permease PstA [Bacillota bacterium]|nr:phosphate ABC transporter permease PstA [Bacillota bacterium]HNT03164.1 phosphate ABC transporter permease PstA [Bacillota bacterium]HPA55474.1 phosphate ABC transporter permease PstA [Bacillota bacterium]HPX68346.1 phosphate ABC transporter permease PstA [Bacillota bacterium]HQA65434.1 phosphate ABC transporter permease PstA [Bacillota bacterium]
MRKNEKTAFIFLWAAAAITVLTLIAIVGSVLINGIGHLSLDFLTKEPENMGKDGGIFSIIITTIYLALFSLLIAAPIGISAAIFLTEYAKEGPVIRLIRFGTETLAGIPSIIFGLFGYVFFVVFLKFRYSMVSGGLTLTFMILPTIIRTAEESIKMVPMSYREGSLALGATKWQTIYKVVLPASIPGILTGVILGIGRVVGETAAVIYTAGSSLGLPNSIWRPGRTMAVHLYILASEGLSKSNMYATATVLIITVLIINFTANRLIKQFIRS